VKAARARITCASAPAWFPHNRRGPLACDALCGSLCIDERKPAVGVRCRDGVQRSRPDLPSACGTLVPSGGRAITSVRPLHRFLPVGRMWCPTRVDCLAASTGSFEHPAHPAARLDSYRSQCGARVEWSSGSIEYRARAVCSAARRECRVDICPVATRRGTSGSDPADRIPDHELARVRCDIIK
jgi:hypothetical protein